LQLSILSNIIKEKAIELGFSLVGITNSNPLINEGEKLKSWINNGYNAGMNWFERTIDKRINPSLVLPDIKSIIVVGLNYYNKVNYLNNESTGKISKYALGNDYHDVMNEKLQSLIVFLKSVRSEGNYLFYADTGPVMERELAQRAGLGWIGKNANLINRKNGSFFFLGCILTDIKLDYDLPETNHCGSCKKCIDACPTNAIIQPHTIDSNKCISYLTIEYKGEEIPKEFKGKFDGWVFGCDACQDVCPWNRFAKTTDESSFIPLIEPNIKFNDWFTISEEEFKIKFKDSPLKRTKHKGLMRNIQFLLRG
jgi:epoxyqueuosine reductase